MKIFLVVAGLLHLVFMLAELFPWGNPALLAGIAKKKLSAGQGFNDPQQRLVATIVHNAGIYNGILAGGLLWAAYQDPIAADVARVLLAGAVAAGIFGTATIKSWATAVQALVGIIGLFRI